MGNECCTMEVGKKLKDQQTFGEGQKRILIRDRSDSQIGNRKRRSPKNSKESLNIKLLLDNVSSMGSDSPYIDGENLTYNLTKINPSDRIDKSKNKDTKQVIVLSPRKSDLRSNPHQVEPVPTPQNSILTSTNSPYSPHSTSPHDQNRKESNSISMNTISINSTTATKINGISGDNDNDNENNINDIVPVMDSPGINQTQNGDTQLMEQITEPGAVNDNSEINDNKIRSQVITPQDGSINNIEPGATSATSATLDMNTSSANSANSASSDESNNTNGNNSNCQIVNVASGGEVIIVPCNKYKDNNNNNNNDKDELEFDLNDEASGTSGGSISTPDLHRRKTTPEMLDDLACVMTDYMIDGTLGSENNENPENPQDGYNEGALKDLNDNNGNKQKQDKQDKQDKHGDETEEKTVNNPEEQPPSDKALLY